MHEPHKLRNFKCELQKFAILSYDEKYTRRYSCLFYFNAQMQLNFGIINSDSQTAGSPVAKIN